MNLKTFTYLVPFAVLAACAQNPVERELTSDGPVNARFATDRAQCIQVAKRFDDGSAKTEALTSAAIGGLIGAAEEESLEGAIGGALIGGAIGKLEGDVKLDKERRNVLIRCMQNRGHNVVG